MFFIQKQRSMWIFYCCPNSAQKYKDAPCLQSCEIMPDNSLCQRQHEACEVFNCPNRERRDESLLPVRASEKNDGMSTEWWDDRWTEPRERRRVAKVSHTRTHTKSFNAALCYLSSLFMRQWRECVWVCVWYSLPPAPSVSPGKMKTPPVVVWWCRWSGHATPVLGVFGPQREARSLDTHTHTHTVSLTSPYCCNSVKSILFQ